MADTFTTSLSIRQIETGTRSGTWGTETNTQYELLDNAFSYVANDLASDADATLTISDGTASNARYFYIKFTSSVSLTATRTITLAPDDSSKIWIVENATTGSQALTFKQGSSGSTVTVSNGNTAMIYADGAGATNGAIKNAFTDLQVTGLDAGSGSITTTGSITGTLATAAQPNITSVGTLTGFTSTGIDDNATSTAITIDSSERVGIGALVPAYNLEIWGATDPAVRVYNTGTGSSDDSLLRLQIGGTTARNFIYFGDTDDSDIGNIEYNHSDNSMRFTANTAEAFRVHSTGAISVGSDEIYGLFNVEGSINFNGNIRPNANTDGGSASAPTICVGYDNDTGFFHPAGNTIGFTTAGQERARFDSAGNFGINTTSPNYLLDVDEIGHNSTGEVLLTAGNASSNDYTQSTLLRLRATSINPNSTAHNINGAVAEIRFNHQDLAGNASGGSIGFYTNPGNNIPGALTERLNIDSGGRVTTIKTTNGSESNANFIIDGNGYNAYHWLDGTAYYIGQNSATRSLRIYSSAETAGVNLAAGGTSWGTFSDERLKENIQDIGSVIEKIKDIRCVVYNRKDLENAQETIGFIAQDFIGKFDQVLDELKVSDSDEETRYSIRYTETIPVLLKAIQEQQTIIESLEARITALEG